MWQNKTFIDLTHTLNEETPTWNGTCGFSSTVKLDYDQGNGEVRFKIQQLKMHAGIGTHIDAPCHCFSKGLSIDQLPLENFFAELYVIDVSSFANADYLLEASVIDDFEKQHGPIKKNSFVAIYTGWSKYWNQPEQYRNPDNQGLMHFPSISREAAEQLNDRGIIGLGIDTISPDAPSSIYPVHRIFLGAGKYIIENMAHLEKMPAKGGYIVALPIKASGATEAPIRCVGIISKK